ncbi:hypothetical protein JB92DRAFT_2836479 [Gautieria morchelliformis]|nr:hypothetical protein JB92DRAFT_2836479 [Gautieria morchelliformis]
MHAVAGNSTSPFARAAFHRTQAAHLRTAILDLFWDPAKLGFYAFGRTSNARGTKDYWVEYVLRVKDPNRKRMGYSSGAHACRLAMATRVAAQETSIEHTGGL